ncbi:MAG: DUF2550 family protein, partial [Streptosporangiaceae bacterium]
GTWRLGIASYRTDEFCWFGVFGISMRPQETFLRRDLAVVSRRPPTEDEVSILGPDRIVVECQLGEPHPPGPADPLAPPAPAAPADAFTPAALPGTATPSAPADTFTPPASAGTAPPAPGSSAPGSVPGSTVELALAESTLTGLLAWLEAAPPGSHFGLAL